MSNVENVSPQVLRGVVRELQRLAASPPAGVKLVLHDNDLTDVVAHIDGPAGTPYAGGVFRVRLVLGREFPAAPPRAYFLTKIFHPNVSRAGEVCVNTLKKDWRPELGLEHVLLAVKCLLIAPNAESALNAEAGALLLERYDDYFNRAKLLTDIHARPLGADTVATDITDTTDTTDTTETKRMQKEAGVGGDETASEKANVVVVAGAGAAEGSGRGGGGGGGGGGAGEGPCAKRERRPAPAPHKQPSAKDKRRILKRL